MSLSPDLNRRQLLQAAVALPAAYRLAFSQTSEPDAPAVMNLVAGPVTLEFEPGLGFVRYVRLGDREILRGIYAAVRDSTWLTVLPKVANVRLETADGGFKLTFTADCTQGPISFLWQGTVTGDAQGTIRFEMAGEAKTSFRRNRIGFCVLHPLTECVGQEYVAEKSDGSTVRGQFPQLIAPNQPVQDLRAITHRVAQGLDAEVRFEGETFEMEDHRNWTDGNFKTYCTPLAKPWPVDVPQGTRVRQAVTVTLKGKPVAARSVRSTEVLIEPVPAARETPLPAIGLGYAPGPLAGLRPAHLRVDWRPGSPLPATPVPLEVAALVAQETDLAKLAELAQGRAIARWLVLPPGESSTSQKWLDLGRKYLKGAPVGGGTNEYFTELNRQRPDPKWLDVACYSLNPQVHAFDNRSLVENLEPQGATVRSARAFLGAAPIAVTPVTLGPRFNPQAKVYTPNPPDARQSSLFCAAWTVGSLKYLAEAAASSVTYYELAGPGGLSQGGQAFPVQQVLAAVMELVGAAVVPMGSSAPLKAIALSLKRAGRRRLLVANLTAEPQLIRVAGVGPGARSVKIRESMGETTKQETGGDRLTLGLNPYAIAFVDS
jgi:hypothetical protein